jgi:hypothetical protein
MALLPALLFLLTLADARVVVTLLPRIALIGATLRSTFLLKALRVVVVALLATLRLVLTLHWILALTEL